MLHSMTGFGQAQLSVAGYDAQIDVRSVNHRYCEIVVRLPREWAGYEDMLKKTVQRFVKRGRVDMAVNIERRTTVPKTVEIDWFLADGYRDAAEQMKARYHLKEEVSLHDLLALPDVVLFREKQTDPGEAFEQGLRACAEEALSGLVSMRRKEGLNLQEDLAERLEIVEDSHTAMRQLAPRVVEDYKEKLTRRIQDLLSEQSLVDEARLAMEVALFADRCNIDEELTRLSSHLQQFRRLFASEDPAGRKMDFILQEMNREINTIGSKANDPGLAGLVIAAKAELEKMREQVQNIE